MKTFFMTLLGVGLGAVIGTLIGLGVGTLAVDFFDVSCFEGACGYAVVFLYAPVGLLIGAVLGGIIFYKTLWSNSRMGMWLYILAGALLGWLITNIVLYIAVQLLVWFLNTNILGIPAADMVIAVYSVLSYIVLIVGVGLGGYIAYKIYRSYRHVTTQSEEGNGLPD